MAESAALLVDDVFPREPIRQWVLSFPFQLRFLFASHPALMGRVLGFAPNSKHRIKITPAKRGKGRKRPSDEEGQSSSPAARRAAMTGFCSCKTGIHAIHGNNLGTAAQTGLQY